MPTHTIFKIKVWHLAVIGAAGLMLPVRVTTTPRDAPIMDVIWAISGAVLLPFSHCHHHVRGDANLVGCLGGNGR